MSSDEITVPTFEEVRDDGKTAVYCSGCQSFIGVRGYGELLEHSLTDCLQALSGRLYNSEAGLRMLASEPVLAKDWLTPEEDEAWKDLSRPQG